jgi:hypothetical protein
MLQSDMFIGGASHGGNDIHDAAAILLRKQKVNIVFPGK